MNEEKCKICGCTNDKAYDGGCWWVAEELCSKCANKLIEENFELKKQLEKIEEKYINNAEQQVSSAIKDILESNKED